MVWLVRVGSWLGEQNELRGGPEGVYVGAVNEESCYPGGGKCMLNGRNFFRESIPARLLKAASGWKN